MQNPREHAVASLKNELNLKHSLMDIVLKNEGEIDQYVHDAFLKSDKNIKYLTDLYCYSVEGFESEIEFRKAEIERQRSYVRVMEDTLERMKTGLKKAMTEKGMKEIKGSKKRLQLSAGGFSVNVVNPDEVPKKYWRKIIKTEVDKVAIKQVAKIKGFAHFKMLGVELLESQTLRAYDLKEEKKKTVIKIGKKK